MTEPQPRPPDVVLAPAKINLGLRVLGRRPDDYHDLETLFVAIDRCDRLEIRRTVEPGIRLVCPGHPDIEGEHNLAARAAVAALAHAGRGASGPGPRAGDLGRPRGRSEGSPASGVDQRPRGHIEASSARALDQRPRGRVSGSGPSTAAEPGIEIRLEKRIPIAAGLGGGSSDAAAVLRWAEDVLDLPRAAALEIAEALGSDVPFFIDGGAQVGRGRGERLSPAPPLPPFAVVVVTPAFGISAAWAYEAWDALSLASSAGSESLASSRESSRAALTPQGRFVIDPASFSEPARWAATLSNDLEVACARAHPEIEAIRERLLRLGAAGARMSGSGPSVFGVFATRDEAERAVRAFGAGAGESVFAAEPYAAR